MPFPSCKSSSSSTNSNVRVVARIRPLAKKETDQGSIECLTSSITAHDENAERHSVVGSESIQVLPLSGDKRIFELDAVFGKLSTQKEVYEHSGAKEAVCESIFNGFNCTIFGIRPD